MKQNTSKTWKRYYNHGIKIRLDKCKFMQKSVEYLEHEVDADGLHLVKN